MTIDKAIEILEETIKPPFCLAKPDTKEALKLGIEALNRVRIGRGQGYEPYIDSLPGETK